MPSWSRAALVVACTVPLALTSAARAGAAPAQVCTQDWRSAPVAAYLEPSGAPTSPPRPLPPAPSPLHQPFHVFCGGRYVTTVWLAPRVNAVEATRVARQLTATAVFPTVRLGVSPARGLTGLASWFWAEPEPSPVRMLPGNGPPIELDLRIDTVRWRFGDGLPDSPSGLGTPAPAPSPIRHVYERTGSYTVQADVVLAGWFWWEELSSPVPSGRHTVTLRHDVVQVRGLLHAR